MSGIVEFRAYRPGTDTVDTDLYDVAPLRDAFKRFASGATLRFLDTDGTKINDYPYGMRVEVQYTTDGGTNWTTRLPVVTLEPRQVIKDGLPIVEVDGVGYAHFLTRRTVEKDYSSSAKSTILKDLIQNFSPVSWVANNVDVQDDSSIDLSLRGITPAEAIDTIASRSADEEWGVNKSLEFFFRQQSASRAPAVGDSDVLSHSLPKTGKRAINHFTVYYTSNLDQAWTEEDREAQQDLKDKLNAPRRVIISDSDSFPEIATEAEAKAKARKRLGEQSVVQTGTVTTPLDYFTTESGDVFSLTISEQNITDKDFRVAQIDYDWQSGKTERTIARNTGGNVDELLLSLSESLSNVRLKNADPNASVVKALRLRSGITLSIAASLTTKSHESDSFVFGQSDLGDGSDDDLGGGIASTSTVSLDKQKTTRALLNLLRDLWQDGNSAFTDLTHLSAGTNGDDPTVADNSLQSPIDRVSLSRFGAGDAADKFEFVGTIPAGGVWQDAADIEELGIADADSGGNHYLRATLPPTTIDGSTRLNVHLEITIDDDSDEQGVVTNTGQERWRDLLIGESGHEATDMVYGTGTTAASTSDTALGNKKHEDTLNSTEDGEPGVAKLIERITSSDADTTNISELGEQNSSDELLSRVVFEAYGEDTEIETTHSFKASNV